MADTDMGVEQINSFASPVVSGICNQEEANRSYLALHASTSLKELKAIFEDEARTLLHSERAAFLVLEKQAKISNLTGLKRDGTTRFSSPLGEGIAGQVAQDNGFYICNSPSEDSLFVPAIDGEPGGQIHNQVTAAVSYGDDVVGVIQVSNRIKGNFTENDAYWLQSLSEHAALAYSRMRRSEDGWALARNLAETIADAIDDKHVSTVGHSDRTRQIALALGNELRLTDDELLELELAALLHDVGRLALSPEAFESADGPGAAGSGFAVQGEKMHLILSEAILRKLEPPPYFSRLTEIAMAHHEHVDGSGYPQGKSSSSLPLAARILAVANAFDMLVSGRATESKGLPLSAEDSLRVLKLRAGTEFDPAVVDRLSKGKLYKIEKRRFPRYDYEAPIEYTLLRESGTVLETSFFETEALNLSEGGILFRSENVLPSHALLRMKINLPTETLAALARVARNIPDPETGQYKIGAYFVWYGADAEVSEDGDVFIDDEVEDGSNDSIETDAGGDRD